MSFMLAVLRTSEYAPALGFQNGRTSRPPKAAEMCPAARSMSCRALLIPLIYEIRNGGASERRRISAPVSGCRELDGLQYLEPF